MFKESNVIQCKLYVEFLTKEIFAKTNTKRNRHITNAVFFSFRILYCITIVFHVLYFPPNNYEINNI